MSKVTCTERAEHAGLDFETLILSAQRSAWGDAWADAVERAWQDGRADVPNLSGCEILDVCPAEIPQECQDLALRIVLDTIAATSPFDLAAWGDYGDDERIGHLMYMQAVGHGVGLWSEQLADRSYLPRGGDIGLREGFYWELGDDMT